MPDERPISELLRRTILCPDKRSLALGRIALGFVLFVNVVRYAISPMDWFAEDGVLSRTVFPRSDHLFSLLFYTPSQTAVVLVFVAEAILALAVLVGYRTKIAQTLALVLLVSIQSRVRPTINGGDRMLCILCFWTLFLPTSDFFSLDARRRGLANRPTQAAPTIAYLAFVVQLAVAYFVNAMRKSSSIWIDGTALAHFFRDPTLTTAFGCTVARTAPAWLLTFLTRVSRVIEYVAPLLIVSPVYTRVARNAAIVLLVGLHVGIGLTLAVGIFSWVMIACYPLLLIDEDWEALERVGARLRERLSGSDGGQRLLVAWDRLRGPNRSVTATPQPTPPALVVARELTALVFFAACFLQGLVDNEVMLPRYEPAPARALADYPHLYQMWGMFLGMHQVAPGLGIDAVTVDGRHVDPLAEVYFPKRPDPRPWTQLPECMNTDTLYQSYATHFERRKKGAREALGGWILAYGDRTKRPEDRIVSYTIYTLEQRIVPVGEPLVEPPEVEKTVLATYPPTNVDD